MVGGIGKSLLQKMGWREGEALGRTKFGMVEPIKLQVKTDRKGNVLTFLIKKKDNVTSTF